jgi:glycine/D-amino acid oxidase-like deaminating enzyme
MRCGTTLGRPGIIACMSPPVDSVAFDEAAPSRADVVVIGGGIVGVAAAFFLRRRGVSVVLCEKGRVAGEQSSRNWGFCRQQRRDPRELPLIVESLRLWRGLDAAIQGDTGFRQAGVLHLADDEATEAYSAWWLEQAKLYQLDTRMLRGRELEELLPGATHKWRSGLFTASDGRAEPHKAAPAIAAAVRRLGGAVLQNCAVRGLETAAGRVCGVVTEKGPIACDAAVLAGGAWSRLFCRSLGIALPQLWVRASVLRTSRVDGGPEASAWASNGFAFRKRLDGGYTVAHGGLNDVDLGPASFRYLPQFWPALRPRRKAFRLRLGRRFLDELREPKRWPLDRPSPFEATRVLDPPPSPDILEAATANLRAAFPAFREATVAERWAGYIDATPDGVPVISAVASLPGFFIATGFSGHGFGIGPGAGRLMAELVTGAPPAVDPAPYRFARFSDGSRIEVIAGF